MKKLLIIKTGTTFSSIREKHGDFEDFILAGMDIPRSKAMVVSPFENQEMPKTSDISAIIITGSHSMVTDEEKWSIALAQWLQSIVHYCIPTLGICFGHQLLAYAFGGEVGYHPKGIEIGTKKIHLTDDGTADPLFQVLPQEFLGHTAHSQTVVKVPREARVLAFNDFDRHHGFALYHHIWGVQFHPEFNGDILREYIQIQLKQTNANETELNRLLDTVQDHGYGKLLLKRFMELIG